MPNKSFVYLLIVELTNLVFLKMYNTEFDEIVIIFTDQNGRPLEIEYKVHLRLHINDEKCGDVLLNEEQENLLRDIDFDHLVLKI